MKLPFLCLALLLFSGNELQAQVTVDNPGNTTPALASSYADLQSAISALQTITAISGPVTINVNAPQTAPPGGYEIRFAAVTSSATPIVIAGNNNLVTAFSPQPAGSLSDAVFKIVGADHITLQHFILRENAANVVTASATNNMTEWGIAILVDGNANGSQNNLVRQNDISLNRIYSNSFGIYSNASHSATDPALNLVLANNTSAPNHGNRITGNTISNVNAGVAMIGSADASMMDRGNFVGENIANSGNIISGWGGQLSEGNFIGNVAVTYGILMNHQIDEGVINNTISSAALSGTALPVCGILKDFSITQPAATFSSSINYNTITVRAAFMGQVNLTAILSRGISTSLPSASITMEGNHIMDCGLQNPVSTAGSVLSGILNESLCGNLSINDNIFSNNFISTPHGSFSGIKNSAAVSQSVNLNNNQLGHGAANCVTMAAGSYTQVGGIECSNAGFNANLSISGNNFQGFSAADYSTNSYYFILFVHTQSSATTGNINNNTFTNLYLNTAELIMLIARNGGGMAAGAGAVLNINDNRVVGTLTKTHGTADYGAELVLIYDVGNSGKGNRKNIARNNFSNISATGENGVSGILNYDGDGFFGGPVTSILENSFENILAGLRGCRIIKFDNNGDSTFISANEIRNVSSVGGVNAIEMASSSTAEIKRVIICNNNILDGISNSGPGIARLTGIHSQATDTRQHIFENSITNLSSTQGNTVAGIVLNSPGSAYAEVYKNLVAGLSGLNASGSAITVGMEVGAAAGGVNHIHNNYIGSLASSNATGVNLVRGLNLLSLVPNSQFLVYFNTIFLNAPASTGTNFGTSGIFAAADADPLNGMLTLRNNIIVNISEAKGTGITVAFRRSSSSFQNFSLQSDNNLFYVGTAGPSNVIFRQSTMSDQTLSAYQARVSPREASSLTELPPFINSVSWNSVDYLHIDPLQATGAESGAVNISPVTVDFDGDVRQGNPGYTGTGTAPDIGADEFNGLTVVPINISSLIAFKVNDDRSRILFRNENETNVQAYTIERSVDGMDFFRIGSMFPNNTGGLSVYEFDDLRPAKGNNFYRVVSTGRNGETSISETALVVFNSYKAAVEIYPNPVRDARLQIRLNGTHDNCKVELYDLLGTMVFSVTRDFIPASRNFMLHLPKYLSAGTYVLRFTFPDGSAVSEKIVLGY